ncbi:unnamed protein product [Clavelina lepadiformis]|uniref:Protein SCAI n=1 Tax=Clavelina lepadiformis TaxID=159417 RepID=A0ABP0F6C8_CLALP
MWCDCNSWPKAARRLCRDLPQYGQRQWQPHFAKTFETYTKLWKFQQENRCALDRSYKLKRWQIGEIASKIGQLYYHYYLRTSETNYLNEAYQFYSAIRSRKYYKSIENEDNPDLLLKKHRYYARFIVVCLLLNYKQDVRELVEDFSKQVLEHKSLLQNKEDEWDMVVMEVREFPNSDPVQVLNAETYQPCDLTMRLLPNSLPPLEKGIRRTVTLGDAIIVGNSPSQMKFSELTIDMFRMVQVLERAPCAFQDPLQRFHKPNPSQERSDRLLKRENPHKYLLYRPTFFQIFTFLSTAVKELPLGNALLVYLSAHGSMTRSSGKHETTEGYDLGGIITNDRKDDNTPRKQTATKNMHCLHPGDLYPFMRKPMLLIVDSDNAKAFGNIPNLFGQSVVCLMASDELPNSLKDPFLHGRLLTNFLYSPLLSFMLVCGIAQTSDQVYEACSQVMGKIMSEIQKAYMRSRTIDESFLHFLGDDFMRLILLRFAFCCCTLRLHKAYKESKFYPKSYPALPDEDFIGNFTITKAIVDIADMLGVKSLFVDSRYA